MSQQIKTRNLLNILKNNTSEVFISFSFNFLIFSLLIINLYDIVYHSLYEGDLNLHQKIEATILFFLLVIILFLKLQNLNNITRLKKEIYEKDKQLSIFKQKNQKLIKKIRKEIEEQFDYWKFTKEEKKIAKFLILGYSTKQISSILNKSEKTIRNQCLSIYKKSGMVNRNDLSGFFLYDFFKDEDLI